MAALPAVRLWKFGGLAAEEHSRLSEAPERKAAMPDAQFKDSWVVGDATGGVVLRHLGIGGEG